MPGIDLRRPPPKSVYRRRSGGLAGCGTKRRGQQVHVVIASYLGWTLDAFDYFIMAFALDDVAHSFQTSRTVVTWAFTLTLAMAAARRAAVWAPCRPVRTTPDPDGECAHLFAAGMRLRVRADADELSRAASIVRHRHGRRMVGSAPH
ncbi:MAG: hypothetical protein WDN04_16855 [Rhodospirillales bacterium]